MEKNKLVQFIHIMEMFFHFPISFSPQPIPDEALASVGEEESHAQGISYGSYPKRCMIAEAFGNGTP